MTKESEIIYVDIHEMDSGLLEVLQARGLPAEEKALLVGDVAIYWAGKSSHCELKRGSDYTNSMKEGRLKQQIVGLYDHSDFPVLIVEGWKPHYSEDYDDDETIAMKVHKYNMSLRTLNRRLTVYESKDMTSTVDIIEEIVRDLKANKLFNMKRPINLEPELSGALKILCGFPQVSRQRAEDLLYKYKTPENAIKSMHEWPGMKIGLTETRVAECKQYWSG